MDIFYIGIGDIVVLPENDHNCDVAGGSCANWNTMQSKNAQNPIVFQTNNFPLTFILENNTILDHLVSNLYHNHLCKIMV